MTRLRLGRGLILLVGAFAISGVIVLALVVQPFVSAVPSGYPVADPSRLQAHVKYLSSDLYPRSFDRSENLERAARYILAEFKSTGAVEVRLEDVIDQEETYHNVIARFGPAAGPLIVVGAHYDSASDVTRNAGNPRGYGPDTHTPGADDNASGVAGLLELARLLGRETQHNSIELVAYTLEEPPHFATDTMGSAWHARSLGTARRDVRFMLSLEMIGCFDDRPGSQRYPLPMMSHLYSDRGNFIALAGRFGDFALMRQLEAIMRGASDIPVYSINAPSILPGIALSDHRNYWEQGIAAFMITDTAFYRNARYHQAGDTFDTLDYGRMAKVVRGVYAITQAHWDR